MYGKPWWDLQIFFVLCDSNLNIFRVWSVIWTKQAI